VNKKVAHNVDNLISLADRTTEEKRKIAIMGGKASGEARREKATLKKTLEQLLDTVPNIQGNEEKKTFRQLTTEGLMIGAISGKAENFKLMAQMLGELEEQQVNETPSVTINVVDNSNLEKAMYEEREL